MTVCSLASPPIDHSASHVDHCLTRVLISLSFALIVGCSGEADRQTRESLVAPVLVLCDDPIVSPDGRRIGFVTAIPGESRFRVVVDGKPGPAYSEIDAASLVFSPNSVHFAYPASREGRWFVVFNGQEGPRFDAILRGSVRLDREGRPSAYAARMGDRWHAVVDGEIGAGYDEIASPGPIVAPKGGRIAWAARRGKAWFVVIDGKDGPSYDAIASLSGTNHFSDDGKRFGYAAQRDGGRRLVVDGREQQVYDEIQIYGPIFSANGSRTVYCARDGDAWHVVVDGQRGPAYEEIGWTRFESATSPGAEKVAYVAKKEGSWYFVREGKAPAEHGPVFPWKYAFSSDGQRMALVRSTGENKMVVVVDGVAGPAFERINERPVFSSDGKRVAYVGVSQGDVFEEHRMVIDEVRSRQWYHAVLSLAFVGPRRLVAFAVRDGKLYRVGVELEE